MSEIHSFTSSEVGGSHIQTQLELLGLVSCIVLILCQHAAARSKTWMAWCTDQAATEKHGLVDDKG